MRDYSRSEKRGYFFEMFEGFEEYERKEINAGAANTFNENYIISMLACDIPTGVLEIMSLIPVLFILTVAFAGFSLQQNLLYFIGGKYSATKITSAKILTLVSALFGFIAAISAFAAIGFSVVEYAGHGCGIVIKIDLDCLDTLDALKSLFDVCDALLAHHPFYVHHNDLFCHMIFTSLFMMNCIFDAVLIFGRLFKS